MCPSPVPTPGSANPLPTPTTNIKYYNYSVTGYISRDYTCLRHTLAINEINNLVVKELVEVALADIDINLEDDLLESGNRYT